MNTRKIMAIAAIALLSLTALSACDDAKNRCLDDPKGRWDEKTQTCRHSTGVRG
ncbi:hypothetical protein [Plectonema phage JingP1]|uniref:Lipoprotein n=1 Tax=Plectonema phage JingP1 TaxID=2961687 RepID=A0A9E7T4J9_9CAUD|nr:hypothetical protein [Plectonema phage JingP1]UVD33207.1 hypothetical protein [Plectonema phage Pbo-yong3]